MFNPLQLMQMLGSNPNPQALMQQMFGSNPVFNRAMEMTQGKSPEQIQQIVRNVAKARGMNETQLNQFLNNFGLKF